MIKDPVLFLLQFLLISLICISNFTVAQNFQVPEHDYRTDSEEWLHMKLGNNESYLPYGRPCYDDYRHGLKHTTHTDAVLELSIINHNGSNQAIGISIDTFLYAVVSEKPLLKRETQPGTFYPYEIIIIPPLTTWNATLLQKSEVEASDNIRDDSITILIPTHSDVPCDIPENSTVYISSMIKLIDPGEYNRIHPMYLLLFGVFAFVTLFFTVRWIIKYVKKKVSKEQW